MDESIISLEKAQQIISEGMASAQDLLGDKEKMNNLLDKAEEKIRELPYVGDEIASIPDLFSMVKQYVTQEYTEVSPKVIASIVSAFLYLIKKKDLISDDIPILGRLDDLAILGVALKLVQPEIQAFKEWRESQSA